MDQINFLGGEVLAGESYKSMQNDFKKQILNIGGMNDKELKKKALELVLEEKELLLSPDRTIAEDVQEGEEDKDEELSRVYVEIIKEEVEAGEIIVKMKDELEPTHENEEFENLDNKIIFKPILKVNYDGIFIPGYPDEVGLIAPQLAFYNIGDIQLLGGNSWNSNKTIELGGKYVTGAIFVDGFFSNFSMKQVQEFNKRYEYFFGEVPEILAAQAFDAAKMVFDIILKNGIDREGIRNGLLEVKNFKGVSGETTILPNGDSEKSLFFISIKNKKRIQVN